MKNLKSILGSLIIAFVVTSCSNSNEEETPVIQPSESKLIKNIHAPAGGGHTAHTQTGDFTKFNLKKGEVVTDDNWDIAFRATTIIVNGGAKTELTQDEPNRTGEAAIALVSNSSYEDLKEAPADDTFKQDAREAFAITPASGMGWYTYADRKITPTPGKLIIVKTIEGNYAKIEIQDYYKDRDSSNPANGRHYTFRYVYNPNVGDKELQ